MWYDGDGMQPIKLSPEQAKKLLYGLHETLDEDQRALILEALEALMRGHGEIWPQDLQRALRQLRAEFKISETEEKAVTRAVFGG
jgi:hypothetical protein